MAERLNIWGLPGCELPGGGRCTACCWFKEIVAIGKPRRTPCKNDTGRGCGIHNLPGYPGECSFYHCSDDSNNTKWGLIKRAENIGQVTYEQAKAARELWIVS